MMASENQSGAYDPTYRQRTVDETLDDHDSRITRLEKGGLVALGYVIGTASLSVSEILIGLI